MSFNTDAEVKGAEIEVFAAPADGLEIIFGAGYIDNNVEDAYTLPDGTPVDRTAVLTPQWNFEWFVCVISGISVMPEW